MSRAKEPMAAWPEYRFPWGWVTIALVASFILGMGVWGYYVDGLGTNFLASGVFWLACSLYFFRRTVRDEKRLRGQEPALPPALADQARAWSGEGAEDEAAPTRPAP